MFDVSGDPSGDRRCILDAVRKADASEPAGGQEQSGDRRQAALDLLHPPKMADFELRHGEWQAVDSCEGGRLAETHQLSKILVRPDDEFVVGRLFEACSTRFAE